MSVSETVIKRLLNKLRDFEQKGFSKIEAMENAINGGWKDFYEPKQKQQTMSFKQQDVQITDNALEAFLDARESGFDLRNVNNQEYTEVEVIENGK